jgi:hypothetical protein
MTPLRLADFLGPVHSEAPLSPRSVRALHRLCTPIDTLMTVT